MHLTDLGTSTVEVNKTLKLLGAVTHNFILWRLVLTITDCDLESTVVYLF
jgi:hypothetical protein